MVVVAKDEDIQLEKLELGPFGVNAYIAICQKTGDSLLIDTPAEASAIMDRLEGTNPKYILLTHNHFDHLGALAELHSKLKVPLAAHALDAAGLPSPPDLLLSDGDDISVGSLKFEVMHTPGHTPGSLCFRVGGYLISGDTIFSGGPGKTGSPGAFRQIIESITTKIFVLPDDTQIYPGHGDSTVLNKEREEFAVFSSRPHDPNLCGDIVWLSS
jgi:glyoxylase-like metal-dependent hydrolase (beta-lactamase superfamily II)